MPGRIWYLVEEIRYELLDGKFAHVDAYPLAVKPLPPLDLGGARTLTFGELVARAQTARPDLAIQKVYPDRRGYFYVVGQAGHVLVRDRANKLFLDPRDGRIVSNQRASDVNAYWRWSDMADRLHFGNFGGLMSKVVWSAAGFGLAGLSLTGAWLHVQRRRRGLGRRWRGAALAGFVSTLLPMLSAPIPFAIVRQFGPVVDGVRLPTDVPPGDAAFIAGWTLITIAIASTWFVLLIRQSAPIDLRT